MKNILIIILLFSFTASFSQNGKNFGEVSDGVFENDLDYELYRCTKDSASKSTAAECGCYVKYSEKWLEEVYKYNDIIQSKLEHKAKEDFILSNDTWIKYRHAENEFAYSVYRDIITDRIGMYRYHEKLVEINRSRALLLKQYCKDMNIKVK